MLFVYKFPLAHDIFGVKPNLFPFLASQNPIAVVSISIAVVLNKIYLSILKSALNFLRTRTDNPKIYMELQKTQNSENNLEKEEQSWRYQAL